MIKQLITIIIVVTSFPAVHAQESRDTLETGRFDVETTSSEILGDDAAGSFGDILDTDEQIKWSVYVPENYDPASPPGIIVHMTQRNLAKIPIGWASAAKDKNLIWISLNKAGELMPNKEMLLAVLSTPFLQNKYSIDPDRIYIAASTISCRPASAAMQIYPDVFKGAIYSTCEPIDWKSDIPESIEQMKKNGYVFVASNEKQVKDVMRRIYNKYSRAGLSNIDFQNVQKLIYGRNIDRRRLIRSIETLDNF